jgi:transposase
MTRKTYTQEFKLEAVRLVTEKGMKVAQAARELGVSDYLLTKWVRKVRENGSTAFPGKGHLLPHEEELRRLQKENRRLQMEKEILKKAITFFREHQA